VKVDCEMKFLFMWRLVDLGRFLGLSSYESTTFIHKYSQFLGWIAVQKFWVGFVVPPIHGIRAAFRCLAR
jgi:hypothetical protein